MLGQDPDEALERAEDRAVDHHRALGLAVAVDVLEREPLRLLEIDRDGGDLPAPRQRVLDVHVDLRAIERAVARIQLEGQPVGAQRVLQPPLGHRPLLVGPERLRRARGELEERLEPERLVPVPHQPEHGRDLRLDLIEPAVDVGVVLRELPHAEEAGQRARALVAVQPSHVREAQRQVAVRAQGVAVHDGGLGAGHRLQAEDLLLRLHQEHVLLVIVPVARLLPQLLVDQDRRGDFLVPARVQLLADEPLQLPHDRPAPGQPDRRPRRDLVEDVEIQLAPELAVVTLLRLLQPPEVLVELLLREPRRAIDPLEHRVLLVAAPVRPRRGEQLEETDLAGGADVRATAEVDEVPLRVQRHRGGVEALEDLDLEALAALPEERDGLRARHLPALEPHVGLGGRAHLVLDPRDVLRRERLRFEEVVVEAVLDGGADGDLHLGKQTLHRLGHDVRGGGTEGRERRRVAVELAGQPEMTIFFRDGHTLPRTRWMVGSGGFEPPTSSASERRSPTELRAYPEYGPCYARRRGVSSKRLLLQAISATTQRRSRLVSDESTKT